MATVQQPTEAVVTDEHQITTLPALLDRLGWEEGTRVKFNVLDEHTVVLQRLHPKTPPPEGWAAHFAGKLGHVFGDHDEIKAYLEEERRSWEPEAPSDPR